MRWMKFNNAILLAYLLKGRLDGNVLMSYPERFLGDNQTDASVVRASY